MSYEKKPVYYAEEIKGKILERHKNEDLLFKLFVVDRLDTQGLKLHHINNIVADNKKALEEIRRLILQK